MASDASPSVRDERPIRARGRGAAHSVSVGTLKRAARGSMWETGPSHWADCRCWPHDAKTLPSDGYTYHSVGGATWKFIARSP